MVKNDGHVVLGDFDFMRSVVETEKEYTHLPRDQGARFAGASATPSRLSACVCGTLPYMAPEVLRNMEYSYCG